MLVFDGVVGSIIFGGVNGIGKGLLVLGMALLALAVALRARLLPSEDDTKWYSLAIALAVIVSVVVLNEREVWASVRFGRLLAAPLAMLYGTFIISMVKSHRLLIYGLGLSLVALYFSQLAFAYYMANTTSRWTS